MRCKGCGIEFPDKNNKNGQPQQYHNRRCYDKNRPKKPKPKVTRKAFQDWGWKGWETRMNNEAEQAIQRAFEASIINDGAAVYREAMQAVKAYRRIDDLDGQFRTLINWANAVYLGGRPEEAGRMVEDAAQLLPALEDRELEPIAQSTLFHLDNQVREFPDDPYAQRVFELNNLRDIFSLETATE